MKEIDRSLKYYRNKIRDNVKTIGVRPYSHNIIGLCLTEIASKFGYDEANKAIDDYDLETHGYRKKKQQAT